MTGLLFKPPKVVEFLGLPGLGKTTLVRQVAARLPNVVSIHETPERNPFQPVATSTKIYTLEHSLAFALDSVALYYRRERDNVLLYDAGLYQDLAYATAFLDADEREIFRNVFDRFRIRKLIPSLVVVLRGSAEAARLRLKARGDGDAFSEAELNTLKYEIEKIAENELDARRTIQLDAEAPLDEVAHELAVRLGSLSPDLEGRSD